MYSLKNSKLKGAFHHKERNSQHKFKSAKLVKFSSYRIQEKWENQKKYERESQCRYDQDNHV
jgi:hypothetical protein